MPKATVQQRENSHLLLINILQIQETKEQHAKFKFPSSKATLTKGKKQNQELCEQILDTHNASIEFKSNLGPLCVFTPLMNQCNIFVPDFNHIAASSCHLLLSVLKHLQRSFVTTICNIFVPNFNHISMSPLTKP